MQESLWEFAVAHYADAAVAAACLEAQDAHGADVCLLLAGLWLERRGGAADAARGAALQAVARPWQAGVCQPLRDLRRAWKAAAATDAGLAALRGRLAALELEAERCLLERLQDCAADWREEGGGDWLATLHGGHLPAALLARLRGQAVQA